MKRTVLFGLVLALTAVSMADAGGRRAAGDASGTGPITFTIFVNHSWFPTNSFTGIIPDEITRLTGVVLDPTIAVDGQQLGVMIGSGQLPDLVYTSELLDQMSDPSISWSYEELIRQYNVDWQLSPQRLAIARGKSPDGIAYTTLNNYSESLSDWENSAAVPMAASLLLRDDMLRAIGNPPIRNFDDLFSVFTQIKQRYPNLGAVLKLNRDWNVATFKVNMGLPNLRFIEQANENVVWFAHDSKYKDTLAFLNRCWRAGFISPDESYFVVGSEAIPDGEWFAFSGCTQNHLPERLAEVQKINPSYSLIEMVPFDTATYLSSSIGWSGTFITKRNKNPERAIKFIQWMFSPEGQALTQAGRPAVDYTQEPGQLPKFSDQWKAALADASHIRMFNPWWYLGGSPTVEAESRVATTDPALVAEAYRVIRSKWGNSPWLAAAEPIGNSDEKVIMDKLTELVNTYEPRIIMAGSEAEFESRFREFLGNADQIGVGQLETYMTSQVKQIKPQYR